ncbi:MAG: glycosyltransferase family 4 protein [Oscillospiraceae bacterium]|nr:glycosyltransferase family 4 protein [Oscillospiraceae bacterium]
MKKVLMTATVAPTIGQFNLSNIDILKSMGYEVEIACNFDDLSVWSSERIEKFKQWLDKTGITYHNVAFTRNPLKINGHRKSFKQLNSIIKNNGPFEFIHCQTPIAGAVSRIVAKRNGVKAIYTAHGFHFYKGAPMKNWMIFYPVEKYCSGFTDVLITINKEDYKLAKEKFKAKKVCYVPGVGVDTNKFAGTTADKTKVRQQLGIPENAFLLFSVGELNQNKNHSLVIRALAKLNNPNIHYMIAGKGDLKEPLEKLSKELGVEKQVHLLGYREDIPVLYKCSDAFVFPSIREGLPVSLMEAMSAGLPVICSRIRGNVDLIENEKGGLLYSADNAEGFAEGISKVYESQELYSKMQSENLKKVKDFDIGVINEKMRKIYSD